MSFPFNPFHHLEWTRNRNVRICYVKVVDILTFCLYMEFMFGYSKTIKNLIIHVDT